MQLKLVLGLTLSILLSSTSYSASPDNSKTKRTPSSLDNIKIKCYGIVPAQVSLNSAGSMIMDNFSFENLGLDNAGVLQQKISISSADGKTKTPLAPVRFFYPNKKCGPIQIVADDDFSESGERSTRIEINITNSCDPENKSRYSLFRDKKQSILDSFLVCKITE